MKVFKELSETEELYINKKRCHAMSLFEAFCDMEVTYLNNKNIVSEIRKGNIKAIAYLKSLMLKNGDKLIHPYHVDYYLCLRFNKINDVLQEM